MPFWYLSLANWYLNGNLIQLADAVRLAIYTRRLKRKHGGYGDTFYIDEVFAGVPDHSDHMEASLKRSS